MSFSNHGMIVPRTNADLECRARLSRACPVSDSPSAWAVGDCAWSIDPQTGNLIRPPRNEPCETGKSQRKVSPRVSASALAPADEKRTKRPGPASRRICSGKLCYESQRNSETRRSNNMHRRAKALIARWLASRIEIRTRRLRRALRDHQRAEVRRIRDADRRALGLRLYAAWSCKEKRAMSYGTVLAWQSPPEEIAA